MRRLTSTSRISAPETLRDVFKLFRFYRDETELEGLFDNVDLAGVLPRQIYHVVHGRPPESIETALAERKFPIADIFAAALRSGEFRRNVVRNVLAAYPEKRRLLFVHIPKCAGSNLSAHLIGRFASLNANILDDQLTPEPAFLRALKHLALELEVSDTIYVHGHVHLATYEEWGALRFGDEVFSVVRDPDDLVLSQVNYVLTRIFSREDPASPDTIGWREEFGVAVTDAPPEPDAVRALAGRIVRHRGVVPPDVMTQFLGNGRAEIAAERIVTRDVEITDMAHYGAWCRDRWQIETQRRVNESRRYVGWDDLTGEERTLVRDITTEDRRLHRLIVDRLTGSGRPFLVGRDLLPVELAPAESALPAPAVRRAAPEPAADLSDRDLMLRFESLGENCEFGLVQRRCGAEPLGLLRFASAPLPKLLDALHHRFEGMGLPENLEVQLSGNGREYMVLDKRFGFLYHAWVKAGEMTPEAVHAREVRRVPFLVRKLIEDLEAGEKIFVYHGMSQLTQKQAGELFGALRTYGPLTLLWAELAETEKVGSVQLLIPGLRKGYMDRFAPAENAHDLSLTNWIQLCRNVLDAEGRH